MINLRYPADASKHKAYIQFIAYEFATDISGKGVISSLDSVQIYTPQAITIADQISYDNFEMTLLDEQAEIVDSMMDLSLKSGASAALNLAKSSAARSIINKSESGKALHQLATGQTYNPNIGALFKSPNLRSFTFTFNFIPSSRSESLTVRDMVKYFRKAMYPSIASGGDFLYKVPKTFKIRFSYELPDTSVEALQRNNEYIIKMTDCALIGANVVYNSNNAAFHADGAPTDVTMSLTFQELRTLSSELVDEGY